MGWLPVKETPTRLAIFYTTKKSLCVVLEATRAYTPELAIPGSYKSARIEQVKSDELLLRNELSTILSSAQSWTKTNPKKVRELQRSKDTIIIREGVPHEYRDPTYPLRMVNDRYVALMQDTDHNPVARLYYFFMGTMTSRNFGRHLELLKMKKKIGFDRHPYTLPQLDIELPF